jgi:YVTN family beta-propeller protein
MQLEGTAVDDFKGCWVWTAVVCVSTLLVSAVTVDAEAQSKAYVAHAGANVVSVIDTATAAIAGTIPGGGGPARIAITRDGTRAYVTNTSSASISVIDTASDNVFSTIATGDQPSAIAVTPNGRWLYVMTAGGTVQVVDTASESTVATIAAGSGGGGIAVTPDGSRVYVADGLVYVIDTASNTVVKSFLPETASIAGVSNNASSVAMAPDGSRVYVGVYTFDTTVFSGFTATGSVLIIDTASESIAGIINLFALPGPIALTADGSRAYVGIQSVFVNTGYGMGFLPGHMVYVIDTVTNRLAAFIDLGDTGSGIGVTPDRRSVYVSIPRRAAVAIVDINTNSVTSLVPVAIGPGDLAIVPATVPAVPYTIEAGADSGTVSTAGGTAVANVLANDRIGGIAATPANVTITQVSSSSESVAMDPAAGTVDVAAGSAVGTYLLVYRICEKASPSNCGEAEVSVTVRTPYIIDAVNDTGSTTPGWTAVTSVQANDTLNGAPATLATVTLSVLSSTAPGISLNPANGSINVMVGTPPGMHTLRYRICEIASPTNCDQADVNVTVVPFAIDAVNDSGWAPRTGGTAVANVLANDTFISSAATFSQVRLSQLSSGQAGISLNTATGAVTVAAGTPVGTYSLTYRICEILTASNCDSATVTVTVMPLQIIASNDSARGSSKVPNIALASVLSNDYLGGAPATPSTVKLSLVSMTPANKMIRLDPADGSVDVLGKTSSGTYSLVYRICETAMPSNCGTATVTLDLSGR